MSEREPPDAGGWMVVRIRETNPPEVWRGDLAEMRRLFDDAGANWSETFLVRIGVGPRVDGCGRIDIRERLDTLDLRLWRDRAADELADEVAVLIRRRELDARSPAGDALLSYRDPPPTPRSDRMAELEAATVGLNRRVRELAAQDAPFWKKRTESAWAVLNSLANRLGVVHEDDKIRAAVFKRLDDLERDREFWRSNASAAGRDVLGLQGEIAERYRVVTSLEAELNEAATELATERAERLAVETERNNLRGELEDLAAHLCDLEDRAVAEDA